MSHAKTADRLVAGDYVSTDRGMQKGTAQLVAALRDRSVPVFVADNVRDYVERKVAEGHVYRIGDWPCLTPPFEWAWIEYPSASGGERRGVWMIGYDLTKGDRKSLGELHTGLVGQALKDAETQSPGRAVRWVLLAVVFVDNGRKVAGPVGSVIWVLDEWGAELGNRWTTRDHLDQAWKDAGTEAGAFLMSATIPALQFIAFAHCKNAVIETHGRLEKVAKAYRRRHGREPMRWQTVRLELPRRNSTGGDGDGSGDLRSFHIVAGHFSHYGNCCPSTHEPKGKLFGRLEGVFWMPPHGRGDPEREVRRDKVVHLGSLAGVASSPSPSSPSTGDQS